MPENRTRTNAAVHRPDAASAEEAAGDRKRKCRRTEQRASIMASLPNPDRVSLADTRNSAETVFGGNAHDRRIAGGAHNSGALWACARRRNHNKRLALCCAKGTGP